MDFALTSPASDFDQAITVGYGFRDEAVPLSEV